MIIVPKRNEEPNKIALAIKFIGITEFVLGFILGCVNANERISDYHSKFMWSVAIIWWGIALISGTFIYAFGEIIQLLYDIKMQSYALDEIGERKSTFSEDALNKQEQKSKPVTSSICEPNNNKVGTVSVISSNLIKCNLCGAEQKSDRKECCSCGVKFE